MIFQQRNSPQILTKGNFMSKAMSSALRSKAGTELINLGFEVTSSERQLKNGTLMLSAVLPNYQLISYIITGTGSVISNNFTCTKLDKADSKKMYKAGVQRVLELAHKRLNRYAKMN